MFAISQQLKKIINLKESGLPVNLPDCYTRIAEIAYYKIDNRDSEHNHELDKWVELSGNLCDEYVTKHKFHPSQVDW